LRHKRRRRMRKLFLLVVLFCVGCTTITGYHKKVTVEKDEQGKIVKTIIEEEVHQPNLKSKAMKYKYLDE